MTQHGFPRHARAPENGQPASRPGHYLAPFSTPAVAIGLAVVTLILLVLFNRLPQIDVSVAGWFFTEHPCPDNDAREVCGSFRAMGHPTLAMLREILHYLPVAIAIALLVVAIPLARSARAAYHLFVRGAITAVAAMLISPLLIVNGFLKEFSGRPRPVDTDLFGGQWPFVEAGRFTDHCTSNCSFVSGEASTGFWLLCLVPLFPAQFRLLAGAVALSLAVATSGLRIAFGGHYLSDVVLGAAITLTVFSALAAFARWRRWYEV